MTKAQLKRWYTQTHSVQSPQTWGKFKLELHEKGMLPTKFLTLKFEEVCNSTTK